MVKIPDITVIQGDCIEVMKDLDRKGMKFKFVFANPPFNIDQDYEGYNDNRNDYPEFTKNWVEAAWKILCVRSICT